jgi:hypothetical protein
MMNMRRFMAQRVNRLFFQKLIRICKAEAHPCHRYDAEPNLTVSDNGRCHGDTLSMRNICCCQFLLCCKSPVKLCKRLGIVVGKGDAIQGRQVEIEIAREFNHDLIRNLRYFFAVSFVPSHTEAGYLISVLWKGSHALCIQRERAEAQIATRMHPSQLKDHTQALQLCRIQPLFKSYRTLAR